MLQARWTYTRALAVYKTTASEQEPKRTLDAVHNLGDLCRNQGMLNEGRAKQIFGRTETQRDVFQI